MADKMNVSLVDDLDGTPAAETLRFGFDGVEYSIDLSKKNARMIKADMARWVKKATRVGRAAAGASRPVKAVSKPAVKAKPTVKPAAKAAQKAAPKAKVAVKVSSGGPSTAEVRAWAKTQGITVPQRGRLSPDLVTQFKAAQKTA